MKDRKPPTMVIGYRASAAGGRLYVRRSDAYYQIAKRVILERYPRWLTDPKGPPGGSDEANRWPKGWTDELVQARTDRAMELYFTRSRGSWEEEEPDHFDPDRWQNLVRRLARFLAFVDRRRSLIEQTHAELIKEYERCEKEAGRFMTSAAECLAEIARRRSSTPER